MDKIPCPGEGRVTAGDIVVCRDPDELSERAAAEVARLIDASIQAGDRFTVALSGGSTPRSLYALLARPEWDRVPWEKIHLFWGDERCVPPDHPDSNYGMAREALISKVPIPAANVHRIEGEKDPELAAAAYEMCLKRFFRLRDGEFPRFDLVLLGLGEDGHAASLFPGSDALRERRRLVVAAYVERLGAWRVTLTLPVLNHAANVWFLAAGRNKADVVKRVLCGDPGAEDLPAALVRPAGGRMVWLVDEAALSGLRGPKYLTVS